MFVIKVRFLRLQSQIVNFYLKCTVACNQKNFRAAFLGLANFFIIFVVSFNFQGHALEHQ